jgi:hypothetical protein
MSNFNDNNEAQRSNEWYRRRLGYITGSEVSKIMCRARSASAMFSDTALTYLESKAAERCISESVYTDDAALEDYLYYNGSIVNRAISYGVMFEDEARAQFAAMLGVEINAEIGSCRHPEIPMFAASPDGMFNDKNGALVNIEIKVPKEATFAHYVTRIRCAADLLKEKPEYYWQIIAAQSCTGAKKSYFITYSRYTEPYLYYIEITRNEDAIKELIERVKLANSEIERLAKILRES